MIPLRIVFAGTPAFGLPCLDKLAASKHHIEAIYTQPDRPAGRGRKLQASAVKTWAEAHRIPVYQPIHFKDPNTVDELAALKPDVLVVIAYGLILPRSVLTIPRLGCINVHASSLPRWRGASPIQHAILHGDKQTGITIMQMDIGMDTGDMLSQVTCDIKPNDTAETLHDHLAAIADEPLLTILNALATGHTHVEKQNNALATYAPKINKEDAAINWHQPAHIIDQHIRAFNPWPIAYTNINELVFRVHQAHTVAMQTDQAAGTILSIDKHGLLISTAQDAILIETLQFPGGKAISVADYLNAGREQLRINMVLGMVI
ncbi:MAG: methionyl-tRNA formyltransferase [Legionellaceae bacterium]|nr:methionyl-tRNA formyltransferase [Legionellaceae bacterium]